MSLSEAFYEACENAQDPEGFWVSLYQKSPYYGGPEEGGWWGEDIILVSYQYYPTKESAEAAINSVKKLAESETMRARAEYGDQCLRESEWLEERGLDHGPLIGASDQTSDPAAVGGVDGALERRVGDGRAIGRFTGQTSVASMVSGDDDGARDSDVVDGGGVVALVADLVAGSLEEAVQGRVAGGEVEVAVPVVEVDIGHLVLDQALGVGGVEGSA